MQKGKQGKIIMDIDAIMDFIFAPDEKRLTDIELEETFLPDEKSTKQPMMLAQRIKHEVKKGLHEQHEAIRANFVTRLLDEVDELDTDLNDMDFGQDISYNTLFHYGFLKEILI